MEKIFHLMIMKVNTMKSFQIVKKDHFMEKRFQLTIMQLHNIKSFQMVKDIIKDRFMEGKFHYDR